jgi:chromosome segregation ATPase
MRDFLNTPSFQNIRLFQAQKENRFAMINTLSLLVADMINANMAPTVRPPAGVTDDSGAEAEKAVYEGYERTIADLQAQNTRLEQTVADQERSIDSYRNQGRNLSVQETTIINLRSQNASLQQTVDVNTTAMSDLRTQNTGLQQTVTARESTINELRTQNSTLQSTVSTRDSTITELRTQNTTLEQTANQLKQQNDAIRTLLNNN